LLKAIEARKSVSLDAVLEQLKGLKQRREPEIVTIPTAAPASPAPVPGPKPFRAESVVPPSTEAAAVTVLQERPSSAVASSYDSSLNELWGNLVEAVGRASAFAKSYLQEAHPVSFSKNVLTIGFDTEFEDHMALFDVPRNHTLLQTKLAELGHHNAQLKFVKAEPPAGWQRPKTEAATATTSTSPIPTKTASTPGPAVSPSPAPPVKERTAPVAFSKDDFKNDPLIQKALEIFKGQIVEVRA